ncbi:MAG: amino acid permease [Pirellulales bacterium]
MSTSAEATEGNTAARPTLRRALGPQMAIAVVVGNVIGSGIFLKPGNIASESGHFGLIISVWVFGGLLCILGALSFAELATALPQAGGIYVYLREAYGRPVAFLFGWTEFLFSRPASIGALAVAFVTSLGLAAGWRDGPMIQSLAAQTGLAHEVLHDLLEVSLSLVLIAGIAWVNVLGVLWGGRVQLATTLVKAGFLLLVALAPLLAMPWIGQTIDVENYFTTAPARQMTFAAQVGAVLLAVMWAYNGWHGITPLAEEVREPQRTIPFALFGGVGVLIVLYVAANFAYHGVLSMSQMQAAGDHAAERMLGRLAGPAGLAAMAAVIMCSTFGAINTNLLQAPRILFAMGRDRIFFPILGSVHVNYRTPAVAICVNALMSATLILAVALAKHLVRGASADAFGSILAGRIVVSLQNDSIFELLTNFVIFSASIFYLLAVLAVMVLRSTRPDLPRPYRTWGYPIVPLAFCTVYVWFLTQIYLSKPLESRVGLLLIAAGVPVYFAYRRWGSKAA